MMFLDKKSIQDTKKLNRADNRGLFIVLYGINNIGKTTQAKLLIKNLHEAGVRAEYIKYPIYDLAPSGVLINNYLRGGNAYKLSSREVQILYAINRTQYEFVIREKLAQGITIVAEDYSGTGIAWGMGRGISEPFLKYINSHLLKEDIAILMDGQRFMESVERHHAHESDNDLANRVRHIHHVLAQEYGWPVVNANQPIDAVCADIWKHVRARLRLPSNDLHSQITKSYPTDSQDVVVEHINTTAATTNPRLRHESRYAPTTHTASYLPVQKCTPDAKLPTRAHADDAGLDLYAESDHTLFEGDIAVMGTGIALAIPAGHVGLIWDKSGLAAQGLKIMGGVIDASYRGEVKVIVKNLSGDVINITKGQKIAQMIIQKIEAPTLREVDALEPTKRGEGGFGSTGL